MTSGSDAEKTGKKKIIKKKIIKKIVRKKKKVAPEPAPEPEEELEPVILDEAPEPEPAPVEVEDIEEEEAEDLESIDELDEGVEAEADDEELEADDVEEDAEEPEEDPNATVPVMSPAKKKASSRRRFGSQAEGGEAGASGSRRGSRRDAGESATGSRSTSRGRAGGTMRSRGERPVKKDNMKIVVIVVCLLMFVACLGLGAYILFFKKELPKKDLVIERNPGQEVLDAMSDAKKVFQSGMDAYEAENWDEAIALLSKAEGMASNAVAMVEEFRSKPEFSGPEFAGWETKAQVLNQLIKEAREKKFTAENRVKNIALQNEPKPVAPVTTPEPNRELTPEEAALEERGPQDE